MSSRLKTNNQFLIDLYNLNDAYRKGKFTMIDEYKTAIIKLRMNTEFGVCHMTPNSLLSNCDPCSTQSAVDKNLYVHNVLLKHNKFYQEGFFKITGEFTGWRKPLLLKSIYGEHMLTFTSLYSGSKPGFDSAINKKEFWLNYAKDRNDKYDLYNFNNLEIRGTDDYVTITCLIHGDFKIKASNFTTKNQGCSKCFDDTRSEVYKDNGGWYAKDWIRMAEKSKYFDSYKMYIIRCWSDDEEFYKVGRTFLTVQRRFKNKKEMPYNYSIIETRKSEDGLRICCLEKAFKRKNKENSYKPKNYFKGGYTECFTKIVDINNGKEIN